MGSVSLCVSAKALKNPTWQFQPLFLPFRLSLFPMCHIRMKNAILRTFSSQSVTSGNCQCAFQAPLWHFPFFPIYHIRMKNGLSRTFSSRSVTSGNCQGAFQALLWHFLFFLIYHIRSRIGLPRTFSSRSITSGNGKTIFAFREKFHLFCKKIIFDKS